MDRPFRLGLIGAGLISVQSHLPSALACGDVELAAIIDPVVDRAARAARTYGIQPLVTRDVGEALPRLDGAIIATPNSTHRELALQCLHAGVHVLIEKPMTTTTGEAADIVNAAREKRLVVAVGYVSRFRRGVRLLKELLEQRYFGRVQSFVHQAGTAGGWSPLSAYYLSGRSSGGGVLAVTGSHFLDRMLDFWGYPQDMQFHDDSLGGPEANCVGKFQFGCGENAMTGSVRYSKTAALPGALVLKTDHGLVTLEEHDDAEIVLRPEQDPHIEHVIRPADRRARQASDVFVLQLQDFVSACRHGQSPACDAEMGLLSVRLIESLYASRQPLETQWYPDPNLPEAREARCA
jgi:predicted dehydrogenase